MTYTLPAQAQRDLCGLAIAYQYRSGSLGAVEPRSRFRAPDLHEEVVRGERSPTSIAVPDALCGAGSCRGQNRCLTRPGGGPDVPSDSAN